MARDAVVIYEDVGAAGGANPTNGLLQSSELIGHVLGSLAVWARVRQLLFRYLLYSGAELRPMRIHGFWRAERVLREVLADGREALNKSLAEGFPFTFVEAIDLVPGNWRRGRYAARPGAGRVPVEVRGHWAVVRGQRACWVGFGSGTTTERNV